MRVLLRVLFACGAVLTAFATSPSPARAERRVAMVVGIDSYPNLGPDMQLQRAVADADSVSDSLRKLGFSVRTLSKGPAVTDDYFGQQFSAFVRDIQPGDIAVFYFAGHGLGLEGANYLVPADMPQLVDADPFQIQRHARAEAEIRDRMQQRSPNVVLLMLDACRNNPFRSTDRGLALSRGLQPIRSSQGVLTIYAAGYGQVALDRLSDTGDPSPNSVFTRVVVNELGRPGINLVDFSEDVRDKVDAIARKAGREQVPAVDNQLVGGREIYLAGPPPAPPPPVPSGPSADEVAWSYVQGSSDVTVLRRFLSQFPDSKRQGEAQARLASLEPPQPVPASPPAPPSSPPSAAWPDDAVWQRIASSTDPALMRAFIDRYPLSPHRTDAEEWLRVSDEATWRKTPEGDVAAQRRYLEQFPDGVHSVWARARIAALEPPRLQPELPARSAPAAPPPRVTQAPAPRPFRPRRIVRQAQAVVVHEPPPRATPRPVHRLVAGQEHRRSGGCFTFAGESHCQ